LNGEVITKLPPGPGRPPGSPNKATLAKLTLQAFGFTPLEALMESTSHFLQKARATKELAAKPNLDPEMKVRASELADQSYLQVSKCAAMAAGYYHARLAIVKLPNDDGSAPPLRVESLSRVQLATLLARIRAGHHLDRDPGGDGEDGAR
jgi:hypothetical protein